MTSSRIPAAHALFATLTKPELHAMADALAGCELVAVQQCVDFVVAGTQGLWHGRARAMMCRRLKHCAMGRAHRTTLVDCITRRLVEGRFSEQFRDQLRLALHLDAQAVQAAARQAMHSDKPWVRRQGAWLLAPERTGSGRGTHAPA